MAKKTQPKKASAKKGLAALDLASAVGNHLAQIQQPSVLLRRKDGDFIHYSIDVEGGNAEWAFSCKHRSGIKQSDPQHPQDHYEWDWIKNPGEADTDDDVYVVTFLFIGVTKYHLVIDHRDAVGSVIEPLQDQTFQGKDDSPPQFAALQVFIV